MRSIDFIFHQWRWYRRWRGGHWENWITDMGGWMQHDQCAMPLLPYMRQPTLIRCEDYAPPAAAPRGETADG